MIYTAFNFCFQIELAPLQLGAATINGAVTTFLGIMPIAFSYYKYFLNYFFLHYVLILAVCLFQGVVVLPVVLSLVGPSAFKPPDQSDTPKPPTPKRNLANHDADAHAVFSNQA